MAKNSPRIYRQGNAKRTVFRILLLIFVIIFVLFLAAFLGFRRYIAYTDTGKLYLNIPWLEGYMDGPPDEDDLSQYVIQDETSNNSSKTDNTSQTQASDSGENTSFSVVTDSDDIADNANSQNVPVSSGALNNQ